MKDLKITKRRDCTNIELIAEVERRLNDPDRLDATYLWREMLRITSNMELCSLMINKGNHPDHPKIHRPG